MNIEVNETDYCQIAVKYEGLEEAVRITRDKVVSEMAKTYPVKGFRKGSVPVNAIKHTFPQEVEQNVKEAMARQAFSDVMVEKNIKPFGYPQFTSITLINDHFKCEFKLNTIPHIELKEYKGFDLPRYNSPSTPEELAQKILQEVRVNNGETVPFTAEDRIQTGDNVIINCQAKLEDKEIPSLSFTGTMLQVGRVNIPGFDDQILGMQLDEVRQFNLKLPEDFKDDCAGQALSFEVKLMMGSKVIPAALDDALAKKCGVETYDELVSQVNAMASLRVKEWENNYLNDQIVRRLLVNHQDIKIPSWISLPEAQTQAKSNKVDWDKLSEEEKTKHINEAEQIIKTSLLLNKIREELPEAQLTSEELLKLAQLNLEQVVPDPQKTLDELYKKGQLPLFLGRIKDEYVLSVLVKTCNIID